MQTSLYRYRLISYWRNIDKKIFFCFLTLFFLGLFFSYSSTSSLAGERLNKDFYFFFSKHLIFALLALVIMIFLSALKTSLLKKVVLPLFILSFISLALVPIIGVEVKGAKRWLDFTFFRYVRQPQKQQLQRNQSERIPTKRSVRPSRHW